MQEYQNLKTFKVPKDFHGKSLIYVQLWRTINTFLFKLSPDFIPGFRNYILRLFGAKIQRRRESILVIFCRGLRLTVSSLVFDKQLFCPKEMFASRRQGVNACDFHATLGHILVAGHGLPRLVMGVGCGQSEVQP